MSGEGQTCNVTVVEIETCLDLNAACISAFHKNGCRGTLELLPVYEHPFKISLYPEVLWSSLCSLKFLDEYSILKKNKRKEEQHRRKVMKLMGEATQKEVKVWMYQSHTRNSEGEENFIWRLKCTKWSQNRCGHTSSEMRKVNRVGPNNLGWRQSIVKKMPKKVKFSYISSLTESSVPTSLHLLSSTKITEKIYISFFATCFVLTFSN